MRYCRIRERRVEKQTKTQKNEKNKRSQARLVRKMYNVRTQKGGFAHLFVRPNPCASRGRCGLARSDLSSSGSACSDRGDHSGRHPGERQLAIEGQSHQSTPAPVRRAQITTSRTLQVQHASGTDAVEKSAALWRHLA